MAKRHPFKKTKPGEPIPVTARQLESFMLEHNGRFNSRDYDKLERMELTESPVRDAIVALQAERDDIGAKIYDPDQVREILEELTNQLDSLADKMKGADSWQKDQLVRKLVTNLEINNKNEVSFRWKKPLENVFNQALKNRTRFISRRLRGVADKSHTPKCANYFSKMSSRATFTPVNFR